MSVRVSVYSINYFKEVSMIRSNKIKSVSVVVLLGIMLITTALTPSTATPALAAKKPRTPTPTATATRTPTPPVSGNWSPTGSMSTARAVHTATRLADGRVLVAGGDRGAPFYDATASAERFDPTSGTWATTGSMATARESHTATVLADAASWLLVATAAARSQRSSTAPRSSTPPLAYGLPPVV
jgi:Kelch motif